MLSFLVLTSSCGQNKKDAADFFLKGNKALSENNYAEAIRLYDEALEKNPDFPDAFLNKGIALMKIGKISDARDVFTQAIESDPSLVQANLMRSETSLQLNDFDASESDLKAISKVYKDSSRYYLAHGNLMQARNRSSEALADFDKAIGLQGSNVEALVNRGAIHYHDKHYQLAKADFTAAAKHNPSSPEALNNLGLIATQEKAWTQAIAYFDLILRTDPSHALALNNKGYALLQMGKTAEAKAQVERSLEVAPENGYAERNLALCYVAGGDRERAQEHFQKALDIAQPVDLLYGQAGENLFAIGKTADACVLWRKGIVLNDSLAIVNAGRNCK